MKCRAFHNKSFTKPEYLLDKCSGLARVTPGGRLLELGRSAQSRVRFERLRVLGIRLYGHPQALGGFDDLLHLAGNRGGATDSTSFHRLAFFQLSHG